MPRIFDNIALDLLDALVAQLCDLTEAEFIHILSTFPLVDPAIKQLTLATYRDLLCLGHLPSLSQ